MQTRDRRLKACGDVWTGQHIYGGWDSDPPFYSQTHPPSPHARAGPRHTARFAQTARDGWVAHASAPPPRQCVVMGRRGDATRRRVTPMRLAFPPVCHCLRLLRVLMVAHTTAGSGLGATQRYTGGCGLTSHGAVHAPHPARHEADPCNAAPRWPQGAPRQFPLVLYDALRYLSGRRV
jgi:hypothetical protein